MVVGSHKGPLYTPHDTIPTQYRHLIEEEEGRQVPDIDADPARFPVKGYETKPGDVVIFHPAMLHAAYGVAVNRPRCSFTFRFIGDDMRWKRRPVVFQDHIRAVTLNDGDEVTAPCFARVWPPEVRTI